MEVAIIAGEISGDIQGARLARAVSEISKDIKFFGIGGSEMKQAGVELVYDITSLAVVGFWEVIRNYTRIRRVFYGILDDIKKRKPKAVILIDYPGFNLRLAKKIRPLNIPVIYYIGPQVWAWAKGRVNDIRNTVNKMIVIFPFEEEFYKKNNVPVEFVGHPFIDILEKRVSNKNRIRKDLGLGPQEKLIGILPGSREQEIKRHLPVFLDAVKGMKNTRFVIGAASDELKKLISMYNQSVPVLVNQAYDIMEASDLILTSSGTATLETACFGTPMVVIYKLNWLTYMFIRSMIKIPDIAMVNVVAGKRVVPELVQAQATPENVLNEISGILSNQEKQKTMKEELKNTAEKLGPPGAVKRAAEAVLGVVSL